MSRIRCARVWVGLALLGVMACHSAPPPPYSSIAVAKVKSILTGLAPTDAESAAVAKDPGALPGLITQWMALPQYQAKMLSFFTTAFEQDELVWTDLSPQFNNQPPFAGLQSQFLQNLQESFGRTVVALIAAGQPFNSVFTTRRFMMTPALMAAYATLDELQIVDGGSAIDLFQLQHPTSMLLENTVPVPIELATERSSPYFMTFYEPTVGVDYQQGCPVGPVLYPSPIALGDLTSFLYDFQPPPFPYQSTTCQPPPTSSTATYIRPSDFTDWQMVTIRPPQPGEGVTLPYDLPSMRAGNDLVLTVPRVGFFTTMAFLARWGTNSSNLARVTLNQTMITALGEPIDLTNTTVPPSLAALDPVHDQPGTECYGCHQSLDPMRQFFRHDYTLAFTKQTDPAELALDGQFAFHGVSASGTSVFDLATLLSQHPMLASAWVQRLCTWANSAPCDTSDPRFQALVTGFQQNYSWNALVLALMSSPLVTYLPAAGQPAVSNQIVPIALQDHLCALLSARLGITDACGLASTGVPASVVVQSVASSWPATQYSRGNPAPVLANTPSPFMRGGLEVACANLAGFVIDNGPGSRYTSAQADAAIQSFVSDLMGLTSDRSAPLLTILQGHFADAKATGASASDALKSTFVLACTSPYVSGIGL